MHQQSSKIKGSTAHLKIFNALKHYDWYHDFQSQKLNREQYLKTILTYKSELMAAGLTEDQIHLSTRFSHDSEAKVDVILHDLYRHKIISTCEYPKIKFDEFMLEVTNDFDHGNYTTYIFPEEARLLYALTSIMKPKNMVFLGSYYGYWAIWALKALKEIGGTAYLIDVDSNVLTLAEKNIKQFNFQSYAHYVHEDGICYMAREKIDHDFLVVDPEGPKEGADPDLTDKAIYYPMVQSADKSLSKDGLVLCHNILLDHPIADDYFSKKIVYNSDQFKKFLPYMMNQYHFGNSYDTTEGVGIYSRKTNASWSK